MTNKHFNTFILTKILTYSNWLFVILLCPFTLIIIFKYVLIFIIFIFCLLGINFLCLFSLLRVVLIFLCWWTITLFWSILYCFIALNLILLIYFRLIYIELTKLYNWKIVLQINCFFCNLVILLNAIKWLGSYFFLILG